MSSSVSSPSVSQIFARWFEFQHSCHAFIAATLCFQEHLKHPNPFVQITDFRAKDMAHTITYEDGNVERRQLWGHRIELQLEAGDGTARSAAQKRKCAGGEQSDAMLCGGSDSQEACTAGGAATTLRSFRTRQRKAPASKVRFVGSLMSNLHTSGILSVPFTMI